MHELTKLTLDNEMDLILVHKRSMKLAELGGMSLAAQTTFATAVSEVARLALTGGNPAALALGMRNDKEKGWQITVRLRDRRRYTDAQTNSGVTSARRLVDELTVNVSEQGTDIRLSCAISTHQVVSTDRLEVWKHQFAHEPAASPYDDIKRKNSQLQELADRLRQSEEQYRQVTNSLPLLIFSLTPDNKLIYVNQGLTAFVNQDLSSLNRNGWLSVFHPDDQPNVQRVWADSVATGMPFGGEWRVRNGRTDEYVWHLVSAVPMRDVTQEVRHWNGFLADIHAQKRMQQTLRDNEELRENQQQLETNNHRLETNVDELSRSNTELAQFAYVASHDLQEPLRKIQAFSTMLTEQYAPALDPTAQDIIRRMQNATGRMQELIRGLLTYSRLNTETPTFRNVSLDDLVADVQGDLETAIRERRACIEVGVLPVVSGNALQLRQLFQNLLSNALKFTPASEVPQIWIQARPVSVGQDVKLPGSATGNYLEISVRDAGIGFDEKYVDRIFSLFQRLHGRNEYSGTGIGLAVCKKVVDNHGGYLTARSQPGQGATFLVYLPV